MKILVVDDERDVEMLFQQVFFAEIRKGEIEIFFAFSAEEALERLNANHTEVVLILSDINMPGMNGLELLRIIKERYPHKRVYMITAYGNDENYNKAQEYGADGYLNKPIDFDQLREKVIKIGKDNSL
jgi:two-component system, response regulator, stage 0 sporulation protein F